MKIPINLASQPFRRDRALVAASVAVSLLLTATLGVLITLAMADERQLADTRADLARLNTRLAALGTEQAQLDAVLRR